MNSVKKRRYLLRNIKLFLFLLIVFGVLLSDAFIIRKGPAAFLEKSEKLAKIPEDYELLPLEKGVVIEQGFIPNTSYLEKIQLFIVNLDSMMKGSLHIAICSESEGEIFSTDILLKDISPAEYFSVQTKLKLKAGNDYFITLAANNTGELVPKVMTVWKADGIPANNKLYINETKYEREMVVGYVYRIFSSYNLMVLVIKVLAFTVFVLSVGCFILSKAYRMCIKKHVTHHLMSQMVVVFGIIALFLLSALISGGSEDTLVENKVLSGIYVGTVFFAITIYKCSVLKRNKKINELIKSRMSIVKRIRANKGLIVIILVSFILRVNMIGTMQRWDAGEYYYRLGTACRNFTFTWDSYWNNFRICGHATLGFSLIMSIGEFLNPRGIKGVQIINLVLTIAAIVCIYYLLRYYWLKLTDSQASILTLLISVTPVFLGTFAYINVDYTMALFFVFLLYAEYKEKYFLLTFWAVMVTQTKETGMVVILGYFMTRILYNVLMNKEKIDLRFRLIFKDKVFWAGVVTGLTIITNMLFQGGIATWG